MSSNGIGLQTARGSGTSGHVQSNIASTKGRPKEGFEVGHYKKRQLSKQKRLKLDKQISSESQRDEAKAEINSHDLRREIEVKCMELRERLEDYSEDEEIIDKKVSNLRNELSLSNEGRDTLKRKGLEFKNDIKREDNDNEKNSEKDSHMYKRRYTDPSGIGLRSIIRR